MLILKKETEEIIWQLIDKLDKIEESTNEIKRAVLGRSEGNSKHTVIERNAKKKPIIWT